MIVNCYTKTTAVFISIKKKKKKMGSTNTYHFR